MPKSQKKPNNLIIVIHEIYGINQHLVDFCKLLTEQNFDVICPNLLNREIPFNYSQEEKAYQYFKYNVGFPNALHKVKKVLSEVQDEYSKIFIIGFSIGATIAWICSEIECVDGIVGFYGSRIRDYTDIYPKCPTLLFFPSVEKSFNVTKLVSSLHKPSTDVYICGGKHGFADPFSPNYNKESAQNALEQTMNFLK